MVSLCGKTRFRSVTGGRANLRFRNKDVIKAKLSEVHTSTLEDISILKIDDLENNIDLPGGEQLQLGWIIWRVNEHEIHHLGELSLILGLLDHEGLDV